jgi:anthranilate/para-aminobenzoate synthase component I
MLVDLAVTCFGVCHLYAGQRFSHIMHIVSSVEGNLSPELGPVVFHALLEPWWCAKTSCTRNH